MKIYSRSKNNQYLCRHIQASPLKPTQIKKNTKVYCIMRSMKYHKYNNAQTYTKT